MVGVHTLRLLVVADRRRARRVREVRRELFAQRVVQRRRRLGGRAARYRARRAVRVVEPSLKGVAPAAPRLAIMLLKPDPTFYASAKDAMKAPPETPRLRCAAERERKRHARRARRRRRRPASPAYAIGARARGAAEHRRRAPPFRLERVQRGALSRTRRARTSSGAT